MASFLLLLAFVAVAVGLAWFLISHDHGDKEPPSALWLAVSFGLAGGLLAGWLESHIIPMGNLLPDTASWTLLTSALVIGVIEEGCKFIPLALYIYKKRYFNEYTDGVIYFVLAGLGLGVPENIFYTLQLGAQAGLVRLIMTPLFQAATTGLVGYLLVRQKLNKRSPYVVCLPLAGEMLLHGLYDFGLLNGSKLSIFGSLLITSLMNIVLFAVFWKAGHLDKPKRRLHRA